MSNSENVKEGNSRLWKIIILVFCLAAVFIAIVLIGKSAAEEKGNHQAAEMKTGTEKEYQVEESESTVVEEERKQVEVVEKEQASYERWLAAGMVAAISMQYPDFTLDGIYLCGETALEEKSSSEGVYVVFTTDGNQMAIHSKALDAERNEVGTIDLYTMDLGFASFDIVDISTIQTDSYQSVEITELEKLISQSMLVSLYEH